MMLRCDGLSRRVSGVGRNAKVESSDTLETLRYLRWNRCDWILVAFLTMRFSWVM